MQNLSPRAHLPAVPFSPRAYMGCGGWDLAQAPEEAVASLESTRRTPVSSSRSVSRPRRTLGCGGGGYTPEFMKVRDEDELSGRRRVTMGCGDEPCEECKAKQAEAQMGCPKCKRIRQRAMMQQEGIEGARRMGQVNTLPDTAVLLVGSLAVAGLFYLALR